MYLRFTVPGTVTRARVAPGPFRAAYDVWCWGDRYDPVIDAIGYELDWFSLWLPVPRRFGVTAKGREWYDGICWFRDRAREQVSHAHVLAALLAERGVPVERTWTRDPGQILYRDPFQVVAKPERKMLRIQPGPSLTGRAPLPGRLPCPRTTTRGPAFERTSKRRKGYPSETRVKRGHRTIKGGQIELLEKLGRNDPCPCGSGKRFQALLPRLRPVSTARNGGIIGARRR